jgi:hypothetical protein
MEINKTGSKRKVAVWPSDLQVGIVVRVVHTRQGQVVFVLSKKRYIPCLVLVSFRNRIESVSISSQHH